MATSVFIWPGISPGGNFSGQMVGPAADNTAAPPFTFLGDLTTGYASSATGVLDVVSGGTSRLRVTTSGTILPSGNSLQWGSSALATPDLFMIRDAANTLALKNGSTTQSFRVYDDATNFTLLKGASEGFITRAGLSTNAGSINFVNSQGTSYVGVDSSAGNRILNGNLAYALTIGNDNNHAVVLGTNGVPRFQVAGDGTFASMAANGQALNIVSTLTELTTIAAAGTTTTTIQMPAASVVLAVTVRVTTVIPTATSFSVGDSGSATRFSTANVSSAANSTDPGTKAGAYYNASATGILLTMNGGTPAANTGRVRVTIYYYSVTPATS